MPPFPHPLPPLPAATLTLGDLRGIRASGVAAGIKASGRPDVALLVADSRLACAGIFTKNAFAAAPVRVCREHLSKSGGHFRAIIVNSGNANACTGAAGEADARRMAAIVAEKLGCPVEEVLVFSTGVIGHRLPMEKIEKGIDLAFEALAGGPEAGRAFLTAIQTTDAYPKEAGEAIEGVRVAGVCKGAGMIHPDMATMLAFVGTDAPLSPAELAWLAPAVAKKSFNAVHVDSHPSTNDSFFLFSTGAPAPTANIAAVQRALVAVSNRLAWLIARDGEGATKVTTVTVRGATSDDAARAIADRVAASGLVRTALFGNDPNWGRFVSQVGNAREVVDAQALVCTLQGVEVFRSGEPRPFDAGSLSKAMAVEDVALDLSLRDGDGEAMLMTSDLSYRYVEVNAEYTT